MWFLQLVMVVNFVFIANQDIRAREVLWFLFPLAALCMGGNHYFHTTAAAFLINSLMNLGVVIGIFGVLFLYAKFKLKKSFFKEAFGLGDALFFIAFTFGFPFVTFIVVFVFSLIFSLVLSVIVQQKKEKNTVPLAGYMAIFLIVVYSFSWAVSELNLFIV